MSHRTIGKVKFLLPQPKEFSDSKDRFLCHLSMNALGIRFCLAVAVTANCQLCPAS